MENGNKKSFFSKLKDKNKIFSRMQKSLQRKPVEKEIIENYPFFAPYAEVLLLKSYEEDGDFLREGTLFITVDSRFSRSEGNQTGEGLPNEEWTKVELPIEDCTSYYIRSDHLEETKESLEKQAIRLQIIQEELKTRKFEQGLMMLNNSFFTPIK